MSAPTPPAKPVSLFYSYSHEDEGLRNKLAKQLKLLQRQGVIHEWHDSRIEAGMELGAEIHQHLEAADVILLLISDDFMASDYAYDKEMARAMERHEARAARVIPIILRPCDWHSAPFGKLKALPKDGKAVTTWTNQDEAFLDIARGIRTVVESLGSKGTGNTDPPPRPAITLPQTPPLSPAIDRAALVRKVSGLSPPDFATLVTSIDRAAAQVSRHGTIPEQAAELIRFAESSNGPGLDAIRRALESF